MPGGLLPTEPNKQLYNGGSEWQNDFADLPDYFSTFYRNYDPALGRFIAVDPLAEENESISPYNYALNNPIRFNDPMGDKQRDVLDEIRELIGGGGGKYGGTWTREGGITWFLNDADEFGEADKYLNAHNAWNSTSAGDFNTGYTNMFNRRVATERVDKGNGLRLVDVKTTRTNKNWLIERLDEANMEGNTDWRMVKNGAITVFGGVITTVGGVIAISTGVAAPAGVVAVVTGIPSIGFGVANIIDGFDGGSRKLPSGLSQAIDIELGGDGTTGQIVDVFSGGIPKNVTNGLLFGYGIYDSNIGQMVLGPRPVISTPYRNPFVIQRDNTNVILPKILR